MSSHFDQPQEPDPIETGFHRFSGTVAYVVVTAVVLIAGALWLPLFGWLVGVLFVWRGRPWLVSEKVIATVIPIFAALGAAFLLSTLSSASGTSSSGLDSSPVPIDGFPGNSANTLMLSNGQYELVPFALTGIAVAVAIWLLAVGIYRIRAGRLPG